MGRKEVVRIGLVTIAILPLLLGGLQVAHFCYWLFDIPYEQATLFKLLKFPTAGLIFAYVISKLERFCSYHRLTIAATLYANSSCFFQHLYPSTFIYNLTNIAAILLILTGIIGCSAHFAYQIKDFIRYARLKSAQ